MQATRSKTLKRRTFLGLPLAAACLLESGSGQAAKMGAFFEYTVFTKGRLQPEDYRPQVIVALHGFLSAMPNYNYYALDEVFGDQHTIVGFNYDYQDVTDNVAEFDAFHQDFLKGRDVIVFGSSLGGFWAHYFANRIGAKGLVMVNPVADPAARATAHLGEHYSKKRDKKIVVTQQTVEGYRALEPAENAGIKTLVLLAEDDEVLDHREAAATYGADGNTTIAYYEEGGHRLDLKRPDVISVIRTFVERHSAA